MTGTPHAGGLVAVAHLTLFGQFELRAINGRLLDLSGQKDRALLAMLALSRGTALSRDRLTGLLWGDRADVQARDSLKHAVKHIRQALSDVAGEVREDLIIADRNEVRLTPHCISVDVIAFEDLVKKGTPESLERASRLSRGEFLDGIAVRDSGFEAWLLAERRRLRRLQEQALTRNFMTPALDMEVREWAAAALLELDPTREAAARVLMQIHVERGESAQALRLFEVLRERLQVDLGAKPEKETLDTYEGIRSGKLRATGAHPMPLANASTQAAHIPDVLGKPSIAVLPFENMSGDPEQMSLR